MSELLKLPQLVEQHRVTDMEIRGSRVETRLDPEVLTVATPVDKLGFDQDFVGAPADDREGLLEIVRDATFHGISWGFGQVFVVCRRQYFC